jgi:putative endopeptidase
VWLLLSLAVAGNGLGQKSSAIPEKREFPINEAVKPCEDFYAYACSRVIDSFELRPDRSNHTFSFSDSAERLLEYKKKYFAGLKDAKPASAREGMLKNYYSACLAAEPRKTEERAEVKAVLAQVDKLTTRRAFQDFLGEQLALGETSFWSWGDIPNQDDPNVLDIYLESDLLTLPEKSYYEKQDLLEELEKLYAYFFRTIGLSHPDKRARDLIIMEKALAKVSPSANEFRNIITANTYAPREDLISTYKFSELELLFKKIPKATKVRNITPKAMAYLNDRLANAPLDTLKDAYLYQKLSGVMDDAYPDFFQMKFDLQHKFLGGPETRSVREERCTMETMRTFTMETDSILLPRMFPNFPKEKFRGLAEKIRSELIKQLESNTWLESASKAEAIRKIKTAKLYLVQPETDEEWDFKPQGKYSSTTPIANQKQLHRLLVEDTLKDLKKPVNKAAWGMGPLTVNAYYHPMANKFVLPIGILQYPFYDPSVSDAANLAAIGSVIGHELGHGIDDKGSQYDADGKLRQWMTANDLKKFKERSDALVAQFNAIGHNGEMTLGENIGDLVGLTTAYRAAFGSGKADPKLQKEFFLQYARAWCGVKRPAFAEMLLKTDPHALGEARTNEQVKHQPAFSEAYQCKQGDKLVLPADKIVRIW